MKFTCRFGVVCSGMILLWLTQRVCDLYQALRALRVAILFVMNVITKLLMNVTSSVKDSPRDMGQHLIAVSPVRARVLCPICLGQNDEWFSFRQYCGRKKVT